MSYEVEYESVASCDGCPVSNTSTTNTETVSVDEETYQLTGLAPGLQYCVRVAGKTSAGLSPFSHTVVPCRSLYNNCLSCCCYYLYQL